MAGMRGIAAFRRKVLSRYRKSGRILPWRRTTDPYSILVSEVMLQQTQVERVIPFYSRWLRKWPTVHDLAQASRAEVLAAWIGLGYNNRAKNLHETAKIISKKFSGDVLRAMGSFKQLPGIGPYTAAAVRIFSTNEDSVTVDTNIRRILIHEFSLDEKINDAGLWDIAKKCLPAGKSREWHNALMDYGSTLLTSKKTGIRPKTTQSRFEGSDRQIRAEVLRLFLRDPAKRHSTGQLAASLRIPCTKGRLITILEGMARDGLIAKKGKSYSLIKG